jgi:hypothetical protein
MHGAWGIRVHFLTAASHSLWDAVLVGAVSRAVRSKTERRGETMPCIARVRATIYHLPLRETALSDSADTYVHRYTRALCCFSSVEGLDAMLNTV